jgi:hypothetical protein
VPMAVPVAFCSVLPGMREVKAPNDGLHHQATPARHGMAPKN